MKSLKKTTTFLLTTLLTILIIAVLSLTFQSTINISDMGINREDDFMNIHFSPHVREQQRLNMFEADLNSATTHKIERNTLEITQITKNIIATERRIEDERVIKIKDLKDENSILKDDLNNYTVNSSGWQGFKTNFCINFTRMGLSFSELFPSDK